jgi:hypothetical protein
LAWAVCGPRGRLVSAETTLELKFAKGEVLQYQLETTIIQEAQRAELQKPFKSTTRQIFNIETTVDDVDQEGVARLRQRITRIRVEMDLPPPGKGKVEYDSDTTKITEKDELPAQRLAASNKAVLAAEWAFSLSRQGRLTNLKVTRRPGGPAAAGGQELFGEQAMRELILQTFLTLDAKPVEPGDSWTRAFSTRTTYGALRTDQKITYEKEIEGGLAQLQIAEEYQVDVERTAPIKIEMTDGKGSAIFDPAGGRLLERTGSQVQTMKIDVMGKKAEQKARSATVVRLVEPRASEPVR